MSFCDGCFKAGETQGRPVLRRHPSGELRAKDKVVLFLPDVHRLSLLLADDYARNVFKTILETIVPDLFNGDPVPVAALEPGVRLFSVVDDTCRYCAIRRPKWLQNHQADVINWLNSDPARYTGAFDPAFDRLIKVAVTYRDKVNAPLLINGCTHDPVFPPQDQEKADQILADYAPGYKREYWEGASHGFALKGDLSDPIMLAAAEGAFKSTMEWLFKHL
ncbi:chlorocatechol-degradation protein [Mycena leptocephala]|nr:chlorocatechol-degradation protein [Mycena leptocephala]